MKHMKRIYILLTICCVIVACKKVTVDFSISPEKPKAGESVKFTNLSSSGEEWEWTFGDGSTSTLKTPTHTYKRPGTYRVSLMVDNKKSLRETKEVTVYDTVPTFVSEDSVFYIYQDYTFTACVYNPYNYEVDYLWNVANTDMIDTVLFEMDGDEWDITNSTLHLYFVRATEVRLGLRVKMNGETTYTDKTFRVHDRATNSVYMRTPLEDYRQRIFGERAEGPKHTSVSSYLDAAQDTVQIYNGYEFRLSELQKTFPELEGFRIANRKIYYRAHGLWVAHIDGANPVQIDPEPCAALTLDTYDNRIYWANSNGVWYMPFVGSDNNKFVTTPTRLNGLKNVQKLAADERVQ